MKYSEIELNSSECPQKGYVLAYTREHVILKSYESLASIGALLGEQDILELHLFDENKEYRLLTTRSKRYKEAGYMIETVADFENKKEEVYCQKTMLDTEGIESSVRGTLYVLNHVSYDETGMAVVDNYRMYIEEGEHA